MQKQLIVIINGHGGTGKDTMCKYVEDDKECFLVRNVSSIDPVKKVAKAAGWNGEKRQKQENFFRN